MICPNPKCKVTDNKSDAIFCHNCGTKLKKSHKGRIAVFIILGIIVTMIAIIALVVYVDEMVSNPYQNQNTSVYYSGDNEIIAEEVAVEEAVVVETSTSYDYSENIIYSGYSGNNYITCNGVYPYDNDNAQYFSANLGSSLNRNHFKISCYFWVEEHKDQWALMLSEGYRILGINLLDNGKIYISTNNQENYYNIGETYQLNTWNYISVEYNYGFVRVNNGNWFRVDMNTQDGDNELSSINYSSGNAFKGYLCNIYVTNLE
jgi:hypothetical protein